MDWATFWATFSKTHLVTLLVPNGATLGNGDILAPKAIKLSLSNCLDCRQGDRGPML
jgi:hypothetical protein